MLHSNVVIPYLNSLRDVLEIHKSAFTLFRGFSDAIPWYISRAALRLRFGIIKDKISMAE